MGIIKLIRKSIGPAVIAAICYSIIASAYLKAERFDETWILYLGNFAFAIPIAIFIIFYNKKYPGLKVSQLLVHSLAAVILGVVCSLIACFILVALLQPVLLGAGGHATLKGSPPQFGGKYQGFAIILFMNAALGNSGTGAFIAVLLPFMLATKKEDQGKK